MAMSEPFPQLKSDWSGGSSPVQLEAPVVSRSEEKEGKGEGEGG